MDRHCLNHPLCLRAGKGHTVDDDALAQGQKEAECTTCGKFLTSTENGASHVNIVKDEEDLYT